MEINFTDIMLDVETLAIDPKAVIVSIAAVKFSFDHDETQDFYTNVDPRDGKSLGLIIEQDTLDWWKLQKPEATKAWMKDGKSVSYAMGALNEFLGDVKGLNVWAQGIDFDFPILKSSYDAVGLAAPWKYWAQCDSRTIFTVAKFNTKNAPRVGNYHDALGDCHTQISWLKKLLKKDA